MKALLFLWHFQNHKIMDEFMRKIIKNIFKKKIKQNVQNFNKTFQNAKFMYVFLPPGIKNSFAIISHITVWKNIFEEIVFITSAHSFDFFSRLKLKKNIKFMTQDSQILPKDIIFNFDKKVNLSDYLTENINSIIIDVNGNSNLIFATKTFSNLEILKIFSDIFKLKYNSGNLKIDEQKIEKIEFTDPKKMNISIYSENLKRKNVAKLILTLKQNFSVNIYLFGKKIKADNFENVHCEIDKNLWEIFNFAKITHLFITDNEELAELFWQQNVKTLFLGEMDDVQSAQLDDKFEIKNKIIEFMS